MELWDLFSTRRTEYEKEKNKINKKHDGKVNSPFIFKRINLLFSANN